LGVLLLLLSLVMLDATGIFFFFFGYCFVDKFPPAGHENFPTLVVASFIDMYAQITSWAY
jgi:hypothetical protein